MNWLDFYKFSILIGWRWPWSKLGLTRLLVPMDIARYFEIPETAKELGLRKGETVLDLSSPKLLSVYIASNINCQTTATDLWEEEINGWKKQLESCGLGLKNLIWKVVDGRNLGYKNNSFDKVFSISVLEHIKGRGDTKATRELPRVLKKGGRLVITVPVANKVWGGYRQT